MSFSDFIANFHKEKDLYDKGGVPEQSRSKRYKSDQRLVRTFEYERMKREGLSERRAYDVASQVTVMQRVVTSASITNLSHWVGHNGSSVPLASWREPRESTLRLLGSAELLLTTGRSAGSRGVTMPAAAATPVGRKKRSCCCGLDSCRWHITEKADETDRIIQEKKAAGKFRVSLVKKVEVAIPFTHIRYPSTTLDTAVTAKVEKKVFCCCGQDFCAWRACTTCFPLACQCRK